MINEAWSLVDHNVKKKWWVYRRENSSVNFRQDYPGMYFLLFKKNLNGLLGILHLNLCPNLLSYTIYKQKMHLFSKKKYIFQKNIKFKSVLTLFKYVKKYIFKK